MVESDTYLARGVSSGKKEVAEAVGGLKKGIFPGAFCKILPDLFGGQDDYCLLTHADGAGTKSSLAYIYWKETGDISVFKDLATDALVMNLDDMACVGATGDFILSNTIGRNKFRVPGEVVKAVIEGFEEALETLDRLGISINFCGGETADVGDLVRTMILDSALTTRMKRNKVIDLDNIEEGDRIIGFASFGQTNWETRYNSGIGSNGLTAARHDCLNKIYADKYPESYCPDIPRDLVYCGHGRLEDPLIGTPLTLGRALLSPTRTYAPLIKQILESFPGKIRGMIHCTGGGQTKCLKFGRGIHFVKNNLFPAPAIFSYIQKSGNHSLKELFKIYNMGHRLELMVEEKYVSKIIEISRELGIESREIGYCQASENAKNRLTIKCDGKTFVYE